MDCELCGAVASDKTKFCKAYRGRRVQQPETV